MNERKDHINLLASLAIIIGAQVAPAQVSADWPVASATQLAVILCDSTICVSFNYEVTIP